MFRLENAQSLVGVALAIGICWLLSENRRRFPWKLAIGAVLVQAVLVLALFGLPALRSGLQGVGHAVDGGLEEGTWDARPVDVRVGPDGAVYFSENKGDRILRLGYRP